MAKFLYLLRNDGSCPSTAMSPEDMQQMVQKYMAWVASLEPEGRLLAAEKLHDDEGRVLRQGQGVVKDGPFSETREVVGGFWIVQASDYADAVALSAGLPWGEGTLEVRQIQED
jgi:hypothetical protein